VDDTGQETSYDVGVVIVGNDDAADGSGHGSALPGYEDAAGWRIPRPRAGDLSASVVKGNQAVQAATEAIAVQVALAADRIAGAIQARCGIEPMPGELGLESVEVSFGITLAAGIQALFTAQAESSAQVTIGLTRRPQAPC
jgi:hypothetical protein